MLVWPDVRVGVLGVSIVFAVDVSGPCGTTVEGVLEGEMLRKDGPGVASASGAAGVFDAPVFFFDLLASFSGGVSTFTAGPALAPFTCPSPAIAVAAAAAAGVSTSTLAIGSLSPSAISTVFFRDFFLPALVGCETSSGTTTGSTASLTT